MQEAATDQPVPFADVLLLRAADSTLVAGARTALDGTFKAEHLALGRYILRTQALNFRPQRRMLTFTAEAPAVALGALRLAASDRLVLPMKGRLWVQTV